MDNHKLSGLGYYRKHNLTRDHVVLYSVVLLTLHCMNYIIVIDNISIVLMPLCACPVCPPSLCCTVLCCTIDTVCIFSIVLFWPFRIVCIAFYSLCKAWAASLSIGATQEWRHLLSRLVNLHVNIHNISHSSYFSPTLQ